MGVLVRQVPPELDDYESFVCVCFPIVDTHLGSLPLLSPSAVACCSFLSQRPSGTGHRCRGHARRHGPAFSDEFRPSCPCTRNQKGARQSLLQERAPLLSGPNTKGGLTGTRATGSKRSRQDTTSSSAPTHRRALVIHGAPRTMHSRRRATSRTHPRRTKHIPPKHPRAPTLLLSTPSFTLHPMLGATRAQAGRPRRVVACAYRGRRGRRTPKGKRT